MVCHRKPLPLPLFHPCTRFALGWFLAGSLVREEDHAGGVEGDDRSPGRGTHGKLCLMSLFSSLLPHLIHSRVAALSCGAYQAAYKTPRLNFDSLSTSKSPLPPKDNTAIISPNHRRTSASTARVHSSIPRLSRIAVPPSGKGGSAPGHDRARRFRDDRGGHPRRRLAADWRGGEKRRRRGGGAAPGAVLRHRAPPQHRHVWGECFFFRALLLVCDTGSFVLILGCFASVVVLVPSVDMDVLIFGVVEELVGVFFLLAVRYG